MERLNKASITIETACLMPLMLLTIFAVIYLNFYVHNRTWLTAAAYESALMGSLEGTKEEGDPRNQALTRIHLIGNPAMPGTENLDVQVQADKKQVQVTYNGDTAAVYGGFLWHLQTKGTSKIIDPVDIIRLIREGKKIGDIITD